MNEQNTMHIALKIKETLVYGLILIQFFGLTIINDVYGVIIPSIAAATAIVININNNESKYKLAGIANKKTLFIARIIGLSKIAFLSFAIMTLTLSEMLGMSITLILGYLILCVVDRKYFTKQEAKAKFENAIKVLEKIISQCSSNDNEEDFSKKDSNKKED